LRHSVYNKNENWLQFLFIVKAAVLKQLISKFYPQIQRTEASDHIYFSQPILTQFGIMMHFEPLDRPDRQKFEILQIQDGGGRHLEN